MLYWCWPALWSINSNWAHHYPINTQVTWCHFIQAELMSGILSMSLQKRDPTHINYSTFFRSSPPMLMVSLVWGPHSMHSIFLMFSWSSNSLSRPLLRLFLEGISPKVTEKYKCHLQYHSLWQSCNGLGDEQSCNGSGDENYFTKHGSITHSNISMAAKSNWISQ